MPSLKLPALFTDHAVLQHSRSVPLWGWTEPGARVAASFRGQNVSARAGADGRFDLCIDTQSPGGPFELVLNCGEDTLTLHDVLVGEVWLCSGQSNMEWTLNNSAGGPEEAAQALHSMLRLFAIPQTAAPEPQRDVPAHWTACRPETAAQFSGVAYHFGKHLHNHLHVPVGLIQSAWGGTTAEAWTSRGALLADPALEHLAAPGDSVAQGPHEDPGVAPAAADWHSPDLDDADWRTMACPQAWEQAGLNIDGAVWFRKTVDLPEHLAGKELVLSLGVIDDFDQTFVNGARVGQTGMETPGWYAFPRRYVIPAERTTTGRLVIAIRVFDQWGNGGLIGGPEKMFIAPAADETDRLSLAGEWKFQVELELPPRYPASSTRPTSLYNAMIHPLVPFALAGAVWYQGESNVDRAHQYRTLFPAMIECWRKAWGTDLPFLFVLLAGFHAHPLSPGESKIAELRDAQLSALRLPATAAASAVDLGDVEDIHPRNKRDVGERLAVAALASVYAQAVEGSGPTLANVQLNGATATLTFTHADGLCARGGEPLGFAVAGENGEFHWSKARIDGEAVELHSDTVGDIRFIRYAWADHPTGNLYNGAGLPMLPFRTDTRAYLTAPQVEEYGRLG